MTVTSTDDLAVGMFVSSGGSYSSDTRIESALNYIDSKKVSLVKNLLLLLSFKNNPLVVQMVLQNYPQVLWLNLYSIRFLLVYRFV